MGDGIVRDVALVERNRLSLEDIGEGLVGGGWITHRARRQRYSADEVLVELTLQTEPDANASAVTILGGLLDEALTTHPDVTSKPELAKCRGESRYLLLVIL